MNFKKLMIIIVGCAILYLIISTIVSVFSNREIFYTYGSKYGNCKIYENGKMIIENKTKGNIEIELNQNELNTLKKMIINDKKEYSDFTYPTSNNPGISVDKVVWSYGYYYNFFFPFLKNTVYDGESSNYVFDLLE